MDYGNALYDSYVYTRSLIGENILRWIVLALGVIIFPVIIGYLIRIAKGEEEKPSLDNFAELFIQGIIGFIIAMIYGIIALIVVGVIGAGFLVLFGGMYAAGIIGSQASDLSLLGAGQAIVAVMVAMYGCFFLLYAIGLPVALAYNAIFICAMFRYSRTGQFGEAFNFDAIKTHIRSVGWINFTMGLWVFHFFMAIIMYFFLAIAAFISAPFIIGGMGAIFGLIIILAVLTLLFLVVLQIFSIKYYSFLYDSGTPADPQ